MDRSGTRRSLLLHAVVSLVALLASTGCSDGFLGLNSPCPRFAFENENGVCLCVEGYAPCLQGCCPVDPTADTGLADASDDTEDDARPDDADPGSDVPLADVDDEDDRESDADDGRDDPTGDTTSDPDDADVVAPRCGDGVCAAGETHASCPDDCPDTCGNDVCDEGESYESCPKDCRDICGNGVCVDEESFATCPEDCPDTCGNGVCGPAESFADCPDDCPDACGNDVCGPTESFADCPEDCPDTCGNDVCGPAESFVDCPDDCPDTCGNGVCGPAESFTSCPADCPDTCGNGVCGPAESFASCATDCPDTCGNGVCGPAESFTSCPADCPDTCGNNVCGPAESFTSCPADCPDTCGNGVCGPSESWESCPDDCDDPCGDVTESGRCTGAASLEYCLTTTGPNPTREVASISCPAGRTCELVAGVAECVAPPGCTPGTSRCLNSTVYGVCENDGRETTGTCGTGCLDTALGATCRPSIPTRTMNSQFTYEFKGPNAARTAWAEPGWALGNGFLVVSFVGDTIIDATISGQSEGLGEFSLLIPQNPGPNDLIAVYAARYAPTGALQFAMVNPDFTGASRDVFQVFASTTRARTWAWGYRTSTWADEEFLTLPQPESGAASQFALANELWRVLFVPFGRVPPALAIWWNHQLSWNCGACFTSANAFLNGRPIPHHIWMDGSTQDEGQWQVPTLIHELGHYVMEAWGRSPGEGGTHFIGIPVYPGMAYSEGFATWFSGWFRSDPLYWARQGGAFFRFNIDTRQYSLGFSVPWRRPVAANGLMQLVDENEISAILWDLHSDENLANAILDGLVDTRTRTFTRGYTRHTWSDPANPAGSSTNTRQPSVMVGDLFDAMHCRASLGPTIERVIQPAVRFPWFAIDARCSGSTP